VVLNAGFSTQCEAFLQHRHGLHVRPSLDRAKAEVQQRGANATRIVQCTIQVERLTQEAVSVAIVAAPARQVTRSIECLGSRWHGGIESSFEPLTEPLASLIVMPVEKPEIAERPREVQAKLDVVFPW